MSKFVLRAMALSGCVVMATVAQADEATIMQHPLASVGTAELETAISYLVPQDRQMVMRSSDKSIRSFLADYFTVKMMAEAAREKNMQASERLAFLVSSYEDRQLSEMLIEDYVAAAKRPDFEKLARERYKAEPELFLRPEQVSAEHILIAINGERSEPEALELAQQLYQKAGQAGADFAALAKEYSDDPSVERNSGRLGFFERTKMVPQFAEAAFALKKGELSKPVKTKFGYHIIHVLDRRAEAKVPFEHVKARLMKEEEEAFLASKRQELVSSFRESKEVRFDEEVMVEFVEAMRNSLQK